MRAKTYLRNKNQTKSGCTTKYYEHRQHYEHGILFVSQHEAYSRAGDAHYNNVVHAHPHVFTVI